MIFLYHSVLPDNSPDERLCAGQALTRSVFELQVKWLAEHYHIVSLAEYLIAWQHPELMKRKLVVITFDDGFRVTFECIFPFLVENKIPVTIFTTTGHLEHGDLLWFSYLKALCFENTYSMLKAGQEILPLQSLDYRIQAWNKLCGLANFDGDPILFSGELSKTYPLPEEVIAQYEGMTHDQIRIAGKSDQVELGAHTVTHPYLDRIPVEKQEWEILESGRVLSELTGKSTRYFAYPAGEYNLVTLDLIKNFAYQAAFAVIPKNLGNDNRRFEIGRVGIYSPSLLKLKLKALGVVNLARHFGLRIG